MMAHGPKGRVAQEQTCQSLKRALARGFLSDPALIFWGGFSVAGEASQPMSVWRRKDNWIHADRWQPGVELEGVEPSESNPQIGHVKTRYGRCNVMAGQFVIRNDDGTFSVMNAQPFLKSYELVPEQQ
jgi:hypothetical protein